MRLKMRIAIAHTKLNISSLLYPANQKEREKEEMKTKEPMNKAIIYIHGKGGGPEEAKHYAPLFPACRVIGFDYQSQTPWEAKEEFPRYFAEICRNFDVVTVIANSIGAYFLMNAPVASRIQEVLFISPIVDMEALITKMMIWANVTERELQDRQSIATNFGETLSWEYLSYVRNNPLQWTVPTHILYGEKDAMTDYAIMSAFASETGATLEVMPDGEHWFHTAEQMAYLDNWIKRHKTRG